MASHRRPRHFQPICAHRLFSGRAHAHHQSQNDEIYLLLIDIYELICCSFGLTLLSLVDWSGCCAKWFSCSYRWVARVAVQTDDGNRVTTAWDWSQWFFIDIENLFDCGFVFQREETSSERSRKFSIVSSLQNCPRANKSCVHLAEQPS